MGVIGNGVPAFPVFLGKSQLFVGLQQHFRIKNPQHHFFTKRRWHGGQSQFHFAVVRLSGFDTAVLGTALFRHVQPAENLQATGNGHADLVRKFVDVVQHPVDAKAHLGNIAPRFNVDIRCALIKGILQQPVNNLDHMLVVGIRVFAGPKVQQLLEVLGAGGIGRIVAAGLADGARQLIELDGVTADILGVGDHAADVFSDRLAQVAFPVTFEGLGAGDQHFILADFNRKNAVSLSKGIGHHPGNRGCVYL